MKKSIIFMAGLIGFALASCEDTSDLGVMQKNEAPVVVPANGVAIQSRYSFDGTNTINLQDFDGMEVPVINIALNKDFPETSTVTGEMQIATNPDFSNAATIALEALPSADFVGDVQAALGGENRGYVGFVMCEQWETAFTSFYGLNPAAKVNYVRFKLFLNDGTQNNILYYSDGSEWWPAMEFMVTPLDAKLDVAPSYTIFYTAAGQTYSQVMYHNPENHVYDDPNFNAYIDVTENDDETVNVVEWWIAPTDDESRTFGVTGTDPAKESGSLALLDLGGIKGQLDNAGSFKIEVNMLDLTYEVKLAPRSLYVMYTGAVFNQVAQLGTEDNVVYEGMAGLLNKWGLTGQAAYKPTLYINDPDVEVTSQNGTVTGGLMYETTGAPLNPNSAINYPGTGAAMYYLTANLQTMRYTGYQCKYIGFVGTPNNWGNPDDDGKVTPDTQLKSSRTKLYLEWTGDITLNAGDQWKIRANDEWVVDFGGADGGNYPTDGTAFNLSKGGDNLVAAESGTFTVTVYLRRVLDSNNKMTPYYMTVTKK